MKFRILFVFCLCFSLAFGSSKPYVLDLSIFGDRSEALYGSKGTSEFIVYNSYINVLDYCTISKTNDSVYYSVQVTFPTAEAISFFFSSFTIPKSATFRIKGNSSNRNFLYRPTISQTLATLPLSGCDFEMTVAVPNSESDSQNLALYLSSFGVDVSETKRKSFVSEFMDGDYCQVDIACEQDEQWSIVSNAVCKIFTNNSLRCTGTIINNTAEDGALYVLTANHCVKDSFAALNSVFTFNHENDMCDGVPLNAVTVSGSQLLATSKNRSVDFTLLKIIEPVPEEVDLYFAGWDISEQFSGNATAIHHPHGDVKKISHSFDAPIFASFQDPRIGYTFVDNSFWLVEEWESGVTSNGSSGGALFDEALRIRGTLTGGDATCDDPRNDYYQRLSYSWDFFKDSAQQLKYWLDPEGTNQTKLDGRGNFVQCFGKSDSLYVLKHPECDNGYVFGSNCHDNVEFGRYISCALSSVGGIGLPIANTDLQQGDSIYIGIYDVAEDSKTLVSQIAVDGTLLFSNAFNKIYFDQPVAFTGNCFVSLQIPLANSGSISVFSNEMDEFNGNVELKYGSNWFSATEIGLKSDLQFCLYLRDTLQNSNVISVEKSYDIEDPVVHIPQSSTVDVYPTVGSGGILHITIEGAFEEAIDFSIFDLKGRCYATYTRKLATAGNTFSIDIHTLPTGVYVLKTYRSRIVDTKRFVVVGQK